MTRLQPSAPTPAASPRGARPGARPTLAVLALALAAGGFVAPVQAQPLAESPAPPADAWSPDVPEPGSVEAIRRHTTDAKYLPESVAYVPDSPTVPSPAEVLGHVSGAAGELSSVAEVHGYFRRLAAASPRVELSVIGTSEEGREILLAAVSDEANLAALDRIGEINRAPGRPAGDRPRGDAAAGGRGEGGLPPARRAPLDRDRVARDADGAGLPAGGLRAAGDPPHPRATRWC
jgi:hypothetical protein